MIISTTSTLEGVQILEYKGIVTGEAILGANIFRDLFAGIRDIVGGRAGSYEKVLRGARRFYQTARAPLLTLADDGGNVLACQRLARCPVDDLLRLRQRHHRCLVLVADE